MKKEYVIVGALLLFFLASGLYYAATNSITSDEVTHITAGYINLHFNDFHFNVEHPPFIKQLSALPLLLIKLDFPLQVYNNSNTPMDIVRLYEAFLFNSGNDLNLIKFVSRIPNILIALFLGILVYLYSKRLNGEIAGYASLALFVFSPSFLGHSPLVTMDTAVSCFYFATIYMFGVFVGTRRGIHLALTGVFLGLSLITKYSALILIPVFYLITAISLWRPCKKSSGGTKGLKNFMYLIPLIPFTSSYKSSFKFIAPALAGFLIPLVALKKYAYSKRIAYISAVLLVILTIAFLIVIADYTEYKWFPFGGATKAYFKGFSCFKDHSTGGQAGSYLLGSNSDRGWWYYFPAAIVFKEPFAFLIIFLLGLASFFLKKEDVISKSLLIIPAIAYLFVAMFLNRVNIGIRHILPVYPFMCVIGGYCVVMAKRSRYLMYALILLFLALAIDVLSVYPAHMSYFNRLIGGTGNGYKYLSDSNLAWGQDWGRLKKLMEENGIKRVSTSGGFTSINCVYYKIPHDNMTQAEMVIPEKKVYVVEITALASGKVKWARKLKPTARAGASLLVYDISDKDIETVRSGS